MKHINYILILLAAILLVPVHAIADASNNDNDFKNTLSEIQNRWATINYKTEDDKKASAYETLSKKVEQFVEKYPDRAEPLIWEGIVLSTWAGAEGGFSALSMIKKARNYLEKSLAIDDKALDGSAYTSLGSLYYQVPGWPVSFGSDKKAREYLKKGLAVSPDGIDSNYFYADYLIQSEGDYNQAKVYLEKASLAAARPNRSLEDEGRQQ